MRGKQVLDLGDRLVGKANFTHNGKYLLEKIDKDSVDSVTSLRFIRRKTQNRFS